MTIRVNPASAHELDSTFSDATGWHVDDDGRLHITQTSKGNVATFHASAWASVERTADTGESAESGPKTTAVATLYTKAESRDGQTALHFSADYADDRNKAWSKYTPALGVTMTVLDAVAENFEQGARYLLTFEKTGK